MDPVGNMKINLKGNGRELTAHVNWTATVDEHGSIVVVGWDLTSLYEGQVEIPHFGRTDTEISADEKVLYGKALRNIARFFNLPSRSIGKLDTIRFQYLLDDRLQAVGAHAVEISAAKSN